MRAYDARGAQRTTALVTALEADGRRVIAVDDAPAVAPGKVPRRDAAPGYRSFAPYFAAWSTVRTEPFRTEDLRFAATDVPGHAPPEPAEFGVPAPEVPPSERRAALVLETFLRTGATTYATDRALPASERTSRLSAHLSFGTISGRTVAARVREAAAEPLLLAEERLSLRAFLRALAHRDFFLQLAAFYEGEPDAPLRPHPRLMPPPPSIPDGFERWRAGTTGYPLIDAGMRQLRETGWMHPRVRLVAASFLCFDLGLDWRRGRDAWDALLTEDDPASATGNWQWVAGVGADLAAYPRIYNPRKQLRELDPEAIYARTWIAELAGAPALAVVAPERHARAAQLALPLFASPGGAYPAPIVDHDRAARAYLRRYRG